MDPLDSRKYIEICTIFFKDPVQLFLIAFNSFPIGKSDKSILTL